MRKRVFFNDRHKDKKATRTRSRSGKHNALRTKLLILLRIGTLRDRGFSVNVTLYDALDGRLKLALLSKKRYSLLLAVLKAQWQSGYAPDCKSV